MSDAPNLDSDHGPAQARVTPPIGANATVAVDGHPVTHLPVPANATLRVHITGREQGNAWNEYDDADEQPTPDGAEDVPDATDAHADVYLHGSVWVTITLDGERKTRFGGTADDHVTVHLEPDSEATK